MTYVLDLGLRYERDEQTDGHADGHADGRTDAFRNRPQGGLYQIFWLSIDKQK